GNGAVTGTASDVCSSDVSPLPCTVRMVSGAASSACTNAAAATSSKWSVSSFSASSGSSDGCGNGASGADQGDRATNNEKLALVPATSRVNGHATETPSF